MCTIEKPWKKIRTRFDTLPVRLHRVIIIKRVHPVLIPSRSERYCGPGNRRRRLSCSTFRGSVAVRGATPVSTTCDKLLRDILCPMLTEFFDYKPLREPRCSGRTRNNLTRIKKKKIDFERE